MAKLEWTKPLHNKGGVHSTVARHMDVQYPLLQITNEVAEDAATILLHHFHEGDSFIETDRAGDLAETDWLVILNDERGQMAAMSIEYGRKIATNQFGDEIRTEAVGALRKAARLI